MERRIFADYPARAWRPPILARPGPTRTGSRPDLASLNLLNIRNYTHCVRVFDRHRREPPPRIAKVGAQAAPLHGGRSESTRYEYAPDSLSQQRGTTT